MVRAELQTANVAHFQVNIIIRIFCISGWLAVPINLDKWSSTILTWGGFDYICRAIICILCVFFYDNFMIVAGDTETCW